MIKFVELSEREIEVVGGGVRYIKQETPLIQKLLLYTNFLLAGFAIGVGLSKYIFRKKLKYENENRDMLIALLRSNSKNSGPSKCAANYIN